MNLEDINLSRPPLFSIVDTKEIAYGRKIRVEEFGETLLDGMRTYRINIENPGKLNLKIPFETISNDFLFSIPVVGKMRNNKIDITLSENGRQIKVEIFCFNPTTNKWDLSEFYEFMPMEDFDENFPTYLEKLIHTIPFHPWY